MDFFKIQPKGKSGCVLGDDFDIFEINALISLIAEGGSPTESYLSLC
jgi:hypothetical protein